MKMKKLIVGLVSFSIMTASCMNNNRDNTDTFKEDTDYRTNEGNDMRSDTFVPTDTDPRRQGIEAESKDSIRVKNPENK